MCSSMHSWPWPWKKVSYLASCSDNFIQEVNSCYTLNVILNGPQGKSGHFGEEKNLLFPLGMGS